MRPLVNIDTNVDAGTSNSADHRHQESAQYTTVQVVCQLGDSRCTPRPSFVAGFGLDRTTRLHILPLRGEAPDSGALLPMVLILISLTQDITFLLPRHDHYRRLWRRPSMLRLHPRLS